MAVGLSLQGPAGLLLAVVVLACSPAARAEACDFQAQCRPDEVYRLAIPCEGKCAYYIQCEGGVPTEKKCGKYFFQQRQFDPDTLECVKSTDCDWWKKLSTTTTTTTTTPAPSTTLTPDTTPASSSTEATSTTVTPEPSSTSSEQPATTGAPSSSPAPSTTPAPSESGAAAPLAALLPPLLAAAVALIL